LQQLVAFSATEAELQELEASLHADTNGLLMEQIPALLNRQAPLEDIPFNATQWDTVASRILMADKIAGQQQLAAAPVKRMSWKRRAVAAALFFILGTGAYILIRQSQTGIAVHPEQVAKQDVQPGSTKAVLVMANGAEVILEEANGKTFIETNGTAISNTNGLLQYNPNSGNQQAKAVYNTLRIPAAGQYQLLLPDGSKVWLNAESSITFPTVFNGNERKVMVTGEVYFEIAANARQPFKVSTNGQEVTVLGTLFNINAYPDEAATKTTLLEGSIRITNPTSKNQTSAILTPGQQSQLTANDLQVKSDVNVEEATAWKNGYFQFEDADLAAVMRQLARWYDIKVVYTEKPLTEHFDGKMQRSLTLVQVLKNLEKIGVRYTLQGKTLTLYGS
jgi:ferric-dicitrate binding protein FerR (iron transport regulator)